MSRGHDDLGEIGAIAAHRLGELRGYRLARVIVVSVKEEDGHRQPAFVHCAPRVLDVTSAVHVPRNWAREAVALQGGNVHLQLLLGKDIRIPRYLGSAAGAAEPAAIASDKRCRRRLALSRGSSFAEQRFDRTRSEEHTSELQSL